MSRRFNRNSPIGAFNRFHGRSPTVKLIAHLHVPRALICLGQAISVVYKCDKLNGGGDGTIAEYVHAFETPVGLFMDETANKQLYLIGEKLKVTSAGIEN